MLQNSLNWPISPISCCMLLALKITWYFSGKRNNHKCGGSAYFLPFFIFYVTNQQLRGLYHTTFTSDIICSAIMYLFLSRPHWNLVQRLKHTNIWICWCWMCNKHAVCNLLKLITFVRAQHIMSHCFRELCQKVFFFCYVYTCEWMMWLSESTIPDYIMRWACNNFALLHFLILPIINHLACSHFLFFF